MMGSTAHKRAAFFLAGILATPLVWAQESEETVSPTLTLHGFPGVEDVDRAVDGPLLVQLLINNSAVEALRQRNALREDMLEQFQSDAGYTDLSAVQKLEFMRANKQEVLPGITLGSNRSPVQGLAQLELRSAKGEPRQMAWRSLAANAEQGDVALLESDEPLSLYYVLEPKELAGLGKGKHTLVAVLDTSKQEGMWQGRVESGQLNLELHASGKKALDDRAQRYVTGRYYLLDEQYDKALQNAEGLTQDYPEFVKGWGQKGDALAGLGRKEEAREAYTQGVAVYRVRQAPQIPEPPTYLLQRIDELAPSEPGEP